MQTYLRHLSQRALVPRTSHVPSLCAIAAWALLLVGLCGACAPEIPATQVIVVVHSDLDVDTTLTSLKVWVQGVDGGQISQSPFPFALTKDASAKGAFTLPLSFGISKAKGGVNRFRVIVEGYGPLGAKGEEIKVIEQVAVASFEDRRTLRMTVFLGSVCLQKFCATPDEERVCYPEASDAIAAGACGPVPTVAVERVDPKEELAGIVGPEGESGGGKQDMDAGRALLDSGSHSTFDSAVVVSPPLDSGARSMGSPPVVPSATPDSGLSGFIGGLGGLAGGGGGIAGGTTAGGQGTCCSSRDCLCHGPVPTSLNGATKGPFQTATIVGKTGTIYYPTNAEPPFAAIALCAGFTNTGPELADWGPFYASYGIVTIITTTGALDLPDVRADLLLASIAELKGITSGPLAGKLSGRYGTSGYSMGGGGTVIAADRSPTLKTSVGLAAWGPSFGGADAGVGAAVSYRVPTLLICGSEDIVAPCADHTDPAYAQIPSTTPKMKMMITGTEHISSWNGPADTPGGVSGGYALAFQKVFLEGDERWRPLLLTKPSGSTQETNIR
jgi:hypothetical protein